jgi:hypothetical protein
MLPMGHNKQAGVAAHTAAAAAAVEALTLGRRRVEQVSQLIGETLSLRHTAAIVLLLPSLPRLERRLNVPLSGATGACSKFTEMFSCD